MDTKLCIDCKHFVPNKRVCKHPSLGISLVDGEAQTDYCAVMRLPSGLCNVNGLLFEPLEPLVYDISALFPEAPFPNLRKD